MLNILITVYLVVFALMMRKDLEKEMERLDSGHIPFHWAIYLAAILRWALWPIVSIWQIAYLIYKAFK